MTDGLEKNLGRRRAAHRLPHGNAGAPLTEQRAVYSENHPIIGLQMKAAVEKHGAKLIVIDPRRLELVDYATLWLPLKPGSNVPVFTAMAHVIVKEQLHDTEFVGQGTAGFAEWSGALSNYAPETVAQLRQTLCDTPLEGYIASCESVRDMDLRDHLRRINAQTLVIADGATFEGHCAMKKEKEGKVLPLVRQESSGRKADEILLDQ